MTAQATSNALSVHIFDLKATPQAIRSLSPETLRHLAAAMEATPGRVPLRRYRDLTDEGWRRLKAILARGDMPTIGFFRRHWEPRPTEVDPF